MGSYMTSGRCQNAESSNPCAVQIEDHHDLHHVHSPHFGEAPCRLPKPLGLHRWTKTLAPPRPARNRERPFLRPRSIASDLGPRSRCQGTSISVQYLGGWMDVAPLQLSTREPHSTRTHDHPTPPFQPHGDGRYSRKVAAPPRLWDGLFFASLVYLIVLVCSIC